MQCAWPLWLAADCARLAVVPSRALLNTSPAHQEGMTPPRLLPQSISSLELAPESTLSPGVQKHSWWHSGQVSVVLVHPSSDSPLECRHSLTPLVV